MSDIGQRVSQLELGGNGAGGSGASVEDTKAGYSPKEIMQMMNAADPANRRISFIGLPDSLTADNKINELNQIITRYPLLRGGTAGIFYKGAKGSKVPTKVGFIEVSSADVADIFVKSLGENNKVKVKDAEVIVKKALTAINMSRN